MEEQPLTLEASAQNKDEEQELLRALIKKGVLKLKPTLDRSGIHYAEAEETWNADSIKAGNILESLEKNGVLESEFLDRVLTCPGCGSPDVHSKYTCPRCKSHNVRFTELIEHMKCGYIGSKDNFKQDSFLVCPRCQAKFIDETKDYRAIGNFYQCEKCEYAFDKPDVVHLCQNCGRTSTHQEAKYIKLFAYKITDEAVKDFQRELPIFKNIKKILTDKGFKVQLHTKITGASGLQSPFDVLAEKKEIRLVIDVSVTGSKNDITALLAKKVDVNPTKAITIDLSNSDELTNLGKVFDIAVFKTANDQDLPHDFENFLASLDSKETSKKFSGDANK